VLVEGAIPFLMVLGCLAIGAMIIVLIVFLMRREGQRQARIRQWAGSRGWTFAVSPGPIEWTSRLPGRNPRGVSRILYGTAYGRPVSVAEYSYTEKTSGGSDGVQSSTTYPFVVIVVRLPVAYPPVAVHSRGALSRLGRAVFGDSPASTGHEEFDQQFQVQTEDPAASRALLGPSLIAEHLAGKAPSWSVAGPDLLVWQAGQIDDPSQIDAIVAQAVRVADLLGR
jgi:hypothetical protein